MRKATCQRCACLFSTARKTCAETCYITCVCICVLRTKWTKTQCFQLVFNGRLFQVEKHKNLEEYDLTLLAKCAHFESHHSANNKQQLSRQHTNACFERTTISNDLKHVCDLRNLFVQYLFQVAGRENPCPRHARTESPAHPLCSLYILSLIHIWRCRRLLTCRSRWSPYH